MVTWSDYNIIVLMLVVMQIAIILVALQHNSLVEVGVTEEKPPLQNTVARLPKPPASPSIFTPSNTLY